MSRFPEAEFKDPLMGDAAELLRYKGAWLDKVFIPNEKRFQEIKEFKVRQDDVFVVSFPKSGTTWLQEITYQIKTISNSKSGKLAVDVNMEDKFPFFEFMYPTHSTPGLEKIAGMSSPRFIKSHLHYHLLPNDLQKGTGKIIYIARSAKDVCASYFNHFRMMSSHHRFSGTFPQFYKTFINGTVGFGPWLDHVKLFWQHRADKNVLFITYEELHQNPEAVIKRVADFLGCTLTSQQLKEIVRKTSFSEMKGNNLVNYSWWKEVGVLRNTDDVQFMRKGEIGDWKNYFDSEMSEEIEKKFLEPLKKEGLTFSDTNK